MPEIAALLPYSIPLLVFAGVVLAVIVVTTPQRVSVRARLEAYAADPVTADLSEQLSRPFFDRLILPGLKRLAGFIDRVAPDHIASVNAQRIQEAGVPFGLTVGTFLLLKAVLLVAVPGAYGLFLWQQTSVTPFQFVLLAALTYAGFRLPDWYLNLQAEARRAAIVRALPDALDLIVICIEAGLGLDAALGRVADRVKGPLSEEIRYTLAEMSMGKRRREALKSLADRTKVPDLASFVTVVIQADQTGVSIGQMLRVQADLVRVRRRQRAQEEGRKAPLKMLLPIVFFILPATFAIILGPAALNILDNFGSFMRR